MEMKKPTSSVLIVLGLSLLIITAVPAKAQMDCATGMLPSLLPCQSFLTNFLPILPSQQCCTAAQNISVKASPASLCQCLRLNFSGSSSIIPFKLDMIPNLCSLSNFLPLAGCILGTPPPPTPLPTVTPPIIPSEHQAPPPNK